MIPVLSLVILILVACCAALWLMLLVASRDIEALEDFIVELDERTTGNVMPTDMRSELAEEADDIRDSRKEEGDE